MLTRAGKIQKTRDVTWEAPPSRIPPPQPLLPIEEAGGGGEESDDDVEAAEVWPLVGRGVSHVRVQRRNREVASGRAGSCLLYTSPSPRDGLLSRMPSSA